MVSAGIAVYAGELFEVPAHVVVIGDTAVWTVEETFTADDPVEFTDNNDFSIHKIRKLKLVDGASGSGLADYDAGSQYFSFNLADYLAKAGGTMTGDIVMSNNKITGLPNATASSEPLTKSQGDTKLPKSGGVMTGDITMGGNKITGLPDATSSSEPLTKSQGDAKLPKAGGQMSGDIDMNGNGLTNVGSIDQEDWIQPALINSWTHDANEPVQYYKDRQGTVHWRGRANKNAATSAALTGNIPDSHSPATDGTGVGNNQHHFGGAGSVSGSIKGVAIGMSVNSATGTSVLQISETAAIPNISWVDFGAITYDTREYA